MNKSRIHPRLTRLQGECEVSVAPAILLLAACTVLVLVLGLNDMTDQITPAPAGQLTLQTTPPGA